MQCAEMQNLQLAVNAMIALCRIIRCTVHEDGLKSAKLQFFHLHPGNDRSSEW